MSTARAAFYFLGVVLLVVAGMSIGRQFEAGASLDWQGPCLIALAGLGAIGVGIFSNLESTEHRECNDPRADGAGDVDADSD